TIAQSTNNGKGVAGVAFGTRIMPVKVLSRTGSGTLADVADGIRFSADHGATVINMSLGGPFPSISMEDAVNHAYKKGTIVVCAAGNSNTPR
ncbi:MAG TPA: peptidase S8, partial [Phycisphaerales bacterium]|nr:peptidase S8 [Phycisphaerales bacterium]